ncbi:MAG: hypothetical protein R2854_06370 [Caldilineaceae bacterium]
MLLTWPGNDSITAKRGAHRLGITDQGVRGGRIQRIGRAEGDFSNEIVQLATGRGRAILLQIAQDFVQRLCETVGLCA